MANCIFLFRKNPAWATDTLLDKDDPRITSLVEKGWDPKQPLPVRNPRPGEKEQWLEERAWALDRLCEQLPPKGFRYTTINEHGDQQTFTVTEEDIRTHGLPKTASKRALGGHHRAFIFPIANAIRAAMGREPIVIAMESVPDDCDDELIAVEHNIRVGQRVMTQVEKFRILCSLVSKGSIISEAQAIAVLGLKRTEGQKLFSWACVNNRFPETRLKDRVTEAVTPDDEELIPITKLTAGAARAILAPAKLTNGEYSSEARPVVNILGPDGATTDDQVNRYLTSLSEGLVSGREASRGIPVKKFKEMLLLYKLGTPQAAILNALIAADEGAFMRALNSLKA